METRAARGEVTNPAVLVGELDAIFSSTYARRTKRFYSTITRSSTTDSCEIHLQIRVVGAQFGRPSFTVASVTRTPIPTFCATAIRQRKERDFYGRRRLDVKVDGQCWTTYFVDLPNNLMAGDEGNIDDRNYPYSGLRAIRRQRP